MTDGTDGRVLLEVEQGIALLTLDRPAKLNALGPRMLADLERAIASIDADRAVRAVIITGAGERSFCVGADVNSWSALEPLDMWRVWVREGHRILKRLSGLRQPTIAAVNGFTFGGGLELALAVDIRIASDGAIFAMPETTIGTLPGWNGTRQLAEVIGKPRAKQMIFTGARIDAAQAERWGLVNEVAPAALLMQRARDSGHAIAANAPVAVQLAKAAIDDDEAALEAMAGALAASGADGREGIAAFREKRSPNFTGQ